MRDQNVLHVALGPYRVRGTEQHVQQMAAVGAHVTLIVADRPEWAGITVPPGVTIHRVGSTDPLETVRAAIHFVLGSGGPLHGADLLIAGDAAAMPVAWAVRRRHRRLPILLEPFQNSHRRTAPADLAVITPWYPSPNDRFAGAFVKGAVDAVDGSFERVSIIHMEDWLYRRRPPTGALIAAAAERTLPVSSNIVVLDTPQGELTRIAVPTASPSDFAVRATVRLEMLRAALPTGRIEAPLIHAHTGIYGGVQAARLAHADARVVVTEHSSFLANIFAEPAARRLYKEMLQRVDALLCVSRNLHDLISDEFPCYANKLHIVPNAVNFDDFMMRPDAPREPLRWLYVGRMTEQKGVRTLVEGFSRIAADEPRVTLTLVGSGPLEDELQDRIIELGMSNRIVLRPAVPPEDVLGVMHRHDLLVHASQFETFGITVVEAVATGMPVLVARSQGPSETLAGLDGKAGLLMEVSDDPNVIAEAYRELRRRFSTLDLDLARSTLLARYGREAVASHLFATYASKPAVVDPPGGSDPHAAESGVAAATDGSPPERVIVVAISPHDVRRTRDFAEQLVASGLSVDLITAADVVWPWACSDGRVRIHELAAAEGRGMLGRAEQLLVYRIPQKLLALARRLARGSRSLWPEAAVVTAQVVHTRVAKRVHTRLFDRGYHVFRPRILWRIARRDVVPNLDLPLTRRVVVSGVLGVTIGWRLARQHRNLMVTTSLARFPGEYPAPIVDVPAPG